jgi:ABC-2 type transport system permease protein
VTRALRAELLKLRTTRTFFALAGSAVALSLVVTVLIGLLTKDFKPPDARDLYNVDATGLFILLLGAIGMAGEWRHRTIANTVLSMPHRLRLLLAKFLAYAAGGAFLSLLVNVAVMAVATLILSLRGVALPPVADIADILWRNLLVAAYLGAIGVAVGGLIRNPAVAIVLLLVVLFVVDNTLGGLVPDVYRFTPLSGAPGGVTGSGGDNVDLLSLGAALAVMAAWLAVFFAATATTFTRRDLV